jgi:hypothetical protein
VMISVAMIKSLLGLLVCVHTIFIISPTVRMTVFE